MLKVQTSIIMPIVGLIAFILQVFFGIDLTEDQIAILVDGFVALTLLGAFIYGGYKAYAKSKENM